MQLTLETYWQGEWRQSATLTLFDPALGHRSASRMEYETDYFMSSCALGFTDASSVKDARAVSVQHPVNLMSQALPSWPAFLLDLMPQGIARKRLADAMGIQADGLGAEIALLLKAAANPIGHLRIKEAHDHEAERVAHATPVGVSLGDTFAGAEVFNTMFDQCVTSASSAIALQGEWPKIAVTQAKDGLFYPDAFVRDDDAIKHFILKRPRSQSRKDLLILQAEAGYARLAQHIGLNVHAPSIFGNGNLLIPRFDRQVLDGNVHRYGQESLVSALGISAFGHLASHEDYIDVLKRHSTDPGADILEYIKRDIANRAFGNPDNHGRNSALTKSTDGAIRLSPLYDFAPMRLAEDGIVKATRWRVTRSTHSDASPNWRAICSSVYPEDQWSADRLHNELCLFAERLLTIDCLADFGIPSEVAELVSRSQISVAREVLQTA